MVRRSPRWRKPSPKVLWLPTSQRTELCYAFEGKADYHGPLSGERVELLLIDQEQHTRWVQSPPKFSPRYPVEEDVDGWRVLGWRLPSGDLRHGDYDVVDPDLADFDRLPVPNTERNLGHSIGAFAAGTTMRQKSAARICSQDHPKRMLDWRSGEGSLVIQELETRAESLL